MAVIPQEAIMSEQRPSIDVSQFDKLCHEIHRVSKEDAGGQDLNAEDCFNSALRVCEIIGVGVWLNGPNAWTRFKAAGGPPQPVNASRDW